MRPTDSAGTSAANAMPIASAGDPGGCRAGLRAKTAICGLNTPSVPPDNTQGTRIRAASGERSSRSASSSISDCVKKPRVKSLTPPFPSVLPITATTWAGSSRSESKSARRAETSFGPAMPSRNTCVSERGSVIPFPSDRFAIAETGVAQTPRGLRDPLSASSERKPYHTRTTAAIGAAPGAH